MLPVALNPMFVQLSPTAQQMTTRDYEARAKSTGMAYLMWFLLGIHYFYMGKPGLNLVLWFSGFFGVGFLWAFIDLFRIPGMVRQHNEDLARGLMVQYRALT